jgi:hypothetical protein
MKRIFKYPLCYAGMSACQEIEINAEAEILSAGKDLNGDICVWAMIEDTNPMVSKNIYCIGTGWPLDIIFTNEETVKFIDTIKEAPYMWHIFYGEDR